MASQYSPEALVLSLVTLSVLAVYFLITFVRPVQMWRQRRSESWPWVKTTIESGGVVSMNVQRTTVYRVSVGYAYSVNGITYGGTYKEFCETEQEANDLVRSLQELPPAARYNPRRPAISVVDPYRDAALGRYGRE